MNTKHILLLLLIAPYLSGFASSVASHSNFASNSSNPNKLFVILMIDDSGSMKDNDPRFIRYAATRLFVSLLDPGDHVAVITFANESRLLTPEVVEITDEETRQKVIQQIQPGETDGFTNILAAFEMAHELVRKSDLGTIQPVIVLLTDGQPRIEHPYESYESDTLHLIETIGVPVLPIAFTSGAKSDFLLAVANLTGENTIHAIQAGDLVGAYLEVFSQIKDRLVVQIEPSNQSDQATFKLDPALAPFVQRISFIAAGPGNVILHSPDHHSISAEECVGVQCIHENNQYQVLTIENPAGGIWKIEHNQKTQDLFAILRTRLRLDINIPHKTHPTGQPLLISVQISQEDAQGVKSRIIGEANFSATITNPQGERDHLDRFYDDGTHGDNVAGDGNYTSVYHRTDQTGEYTLQVDGWKGLVPLSAVAKLTVLDFPQVIIVTPDLPHYEIRNDPIRIEAHLVLNNSPYFDASALTAHISTPDQQIIELPLTPDEGTYFGYFLPTETGRYDIEIDLQNATYLGIPYSLGTETTFTTDVIPTIHIEPGSELAITSEIHQMQSGWKIEFTFYSTSAHPEYLEVTLNNIPGIDIADSTPLEILPKGESEIELTLITQERLDPGRYSGTLAFSSRKQVDIHNVNHEIQIEIVQPTLSLPAQATLSSPCGCMNWQGAITVPIAAMSLISETISLSVYPDSPFEIVPDQLLIYPDQNSLTIEVWPSGNLVPGDYQLAVNVHSREGLVVEPDTFYLKFEVLPLWVRCRTLLSQMSLVTGTLIFFTLRIRKTIRERSKPPIVTGAIRTWPDGMANKAQEIDLSNLQKNSLTLGSSTEADCLISGESIQPFHVQLQAQRNGNISRIELIPKAPVQINYRVFDAPFYIEHGDIFQIGSWHIQYLSDEGF